MSNNKDVKRGIVLYIDGKEVKSDVTAIKAELRKLTKELDHMTIGSKEYQAQMAKIRGLNTILGEHKAKLRQVNEEVTKSRFSVGKMVDGFNRFGGVILSLIGFLTGFTLALRSIRDERNKLEESQAGLKALTGLDDDSIAWLTSQAKTLSTTMTKEGLRVRQSTAEILNAFMLVGSAKPELLGDKEALKAVTEEAMRLQAAAKDITLNEAVDSLTLSLNQYGATADQAGRFVNVLAAGSKEGAVNIASQAKAIQKSGTIAASSNIPIEELVGTIEMLGEKGIKDEVAGTGLKTFFTRLATGATDTNPKVVGLANALDNLNKKVEAAEAQKVGGGTTLLKKLFGDEGMQTAMILTQNIEQVKKYTAAVTDTNIAYEQSAINSDTAAAKLDQARNKMKLAAIDLGEKLNPAFTFSTNMLTYVIKILPGVIDWFKEWGGVIVSCSAVLIAYGSYLKAVSIYHTALNFVTKQATIIQAAYRIATIALNDSLAGDYKALTRLCLQMRSANVLTKMVTASTLLFKAAINALTLRFGAATKAARASWAVMRLNPIGAIITFVAAAAGAFYLYSKRMSEAARRQRELKDIHREAEKSISEEKNKIEALRKVLEDSKAGYDKRKAALNEIKSIVPEYHASLTEEGKLINNNSQALDGYVEKLLLTAKQQAANAKLQEALSQRSDWVKDNGSDAMKFKYLEWEINDPINAGKSMEELAALNGISPTAYKVWSAQKKRLDENVRYYEGMMQGYTNELLAINEKYKTAEVLDPENNKPKGGGGSESEEERKKRVKKELEKIEIKHGEKVASIKQRYLNDDRMSQSEYSQQIQEAELSLLNEKLKIIGMESTERQRINDQILNIQIKMKEKRLALGLKETKDILSVQEKRLQLELEKLAEDHKKHLLSREEFLKKIKELQQRYGKNMPDLPNIITEEQQKELDKYLEKLNAIIGKYQKLKEEPKKWNEVVQKNWKEINKYTNVSSDEISAVIASLIIDLYKLKVDGTESFVDLKDSGEAMFLALSSLSAQFGIAVGEMLAGEEEAISEFLKNTLSMVLTAIEQLMIAYIAQTTMRNIAELGLWGMLKAAKEIALITAAFETTKGILGNFYTGGYTGPGDWDQPQGIVHSDEFVANRYAVANPAIRPVLDLIDSAQRAGSIANLTGDDIAAVVSGNKSPLPVIQYVTSQSSGKQSTDPALLEVLSECNHVLDLLHSRLNEPFVTENSVIGRKGIKQALDKYDSLIKNVSR